jgi:O-methyltransferase
VKTDAELGTERGPAELYLDIVGRSLLDAIYVHPELIPVAPRGLFKRAIVSLLDRRGYRLVTEQRFDPARRAEGKGWPYHAHTMMGSARLENIRDCMISAIRDGVQGDVIETGVWRGGGAIFMRAVLRAYGITDRTVWVADSFRGLPPPDVERYPADEGFDLHTYDVLAVSLDEVKRNFERYGLLDDQVEFLEGWFRDTLPAAPMGQLAVMRLDGDLYESTMDELTSLYPKLSPGGYVIVDDYRPIEACRAAVDDFRQSQSADEELHTVDWSAVYWRRA